ncbi:uncharacterized protein LOC128742141 [Sabethes cyaneus]|uniref:uncharacterized protein LOC128742141 n=1 Tax=Sabethes cyaneus TaxID=53552 RepID=UPI00237D37F0|nr:uncharacterized protein LOC128742141 [Sabethes cyaneus]
MGRKTCSVKTCFNTSNVSRNRQLSMYSFPIDTDLCEKWVEFCKVDLLNDLLVLRGSAFLHKTNYAVCSDHFESKFFINPNLTSQGLHKGSIPTVTKLLAIKAIRPQTQNDPKSSGDVVQIVRDTERQTAMEERVRGTDANTIEHQPTRTKIINSATASKGFVCGCKELSLYKTKFIAERSRGAELVKKYNEIREKKKKITSSYTDHQRAIKRVSDSIDNFKAKMRRAAEQRGIDINLSAEESSEDDASDIL